MFCSEGDEAQLPGEAVGASSLGVLKFRWDGWGFGQSDPMEVSLTNDRGLELDGLVRSLPTHTVL